MKANDIRKGMVILYNDTPYRVMAFNHNTPGKGGALVQTKLRNLLTGNQTEVRFNSTEEVERADVTTVPATYLYSALDGYHFMNSETYEEAILTEDVLGDGKYYLHDQMPVIITLYGEEPIGVELPTTVVLTVVETEPELKGATQSGSYKPAKTDTGLSLGVPPFIKEGEKIVVNTDEGTYVSRAV
ncbi:MAG: elongation factor P [Bdellovibrionota bacterium]